MNNLASIPIHERLKSFFFVIMTSFIFIIVRLVYLQVYLNQTFLMRSQQNFLRHEKIPSRRGNIVDKRGSLLATNKPIIVLSWQGTGNRHLTPQQVEILRQLSELLHEPFTAQDYISLIKDAERTGKSCVLYTNVPFEILTKITEQFPENPNVQLTTTLKRCYPYKNHACHIVGYIGSINLEASGKMGLEKVLDDNLKGEPGELLKKINSFGARLYQEEIKEALAGQDILTTLDMHLQEIAESVFPAELSGSLILMDPKTGAIRALVSRPSFDPEVFLSPINAQDWDTLQANQPFLNRALATCYPPASLFKLVTLSAALEHGIISAETMCYCKGYTRFRGRKYHCGQQLGHGMLSIKESIAQSCNIIFFEIAKKISIDTLADYARRFGLGEKTDILLPENAGLVPSSSWKQRVKHEPWWPGETLSAVIGQSYLLATPMQMACMISSIFEGFRVKPRILEQEPIIRIPLGIKRETRNFLKTAMEAVVDQGTAMRLKSLKGFKTYAKTGTAQVVALDKKEAFSGQQYLEHAWCGVYFSYEDHDPLMLILMAEHTGSSKVTTKIAKQFLLRYKDYQKTF